MLQGETAILGHQDPKTYHPDTTFLGRRFKLLCYDSAILAVKC